MNRIYQGKITEVEIAQSKTDFVSTPFGLAANCPVYQHHRIFQDAINYYLVHLAAMAVPVYAENNRMMVDVRTRIAEAWETFRAGTDGVSLRSSLSPWMPELKEDSTLEQAFELILRDVQNHHACSLALGLLLSKCGGDAGIQQNGRGYFPRFCDAKSKPTWDYSASALASSTGKDELASVLHSTASQTELEDLAEKMCLTWLVKCDPVKEFIGPEAKTRLKEAILHLIEAFKSPTARIDEMAALLTDDPIAYLSSRLEMIDLMDDQIAIPRNRKAAKDVTFGALAFMYFPYPVTQGFLKLFVKAPLKTTAKKVQPEESIDFGILGNDPILLSRGERGYVFPAFTALPAWNSVSPGEPSWKEFDIAAFKEALKALNQFNQKTAERQKDLMKLLKQKAYILAVPGAKWEDARDNDEHRSPLQLGSDARYPILKSLEFELSDTLNEGDWKISRSSIRGLPEIIEKWQNEKNPTEQNLTKIVKDYQRDEKNQRDIGSLPLFLALCQKQYWPAWQQEECAEEDHDEKPIGIFRAVADYHDLERDIERKMQPIKLTPAEAKYSRRLYMFSDLSGRSATKFTGSSVEVSLAWRGDSGVSEKRAKLTFSAPRLGRDSLLGGDHANWLQPMIKALGFSDPSDAKAFYSAVSLMPDFDRKNQLRLLLNFPVTLDPSWIHAAIGRTNFWKNQFNGTREENLHLHWPDTASEAALRAPWWAQPTIINHGFTILANDLGQRTAGAWSLITVTTEKPITKKKWRLLGQAGGHSWYAILTAQGMHRLPGEDTKVLENGKWITEKSGSKGRLATKEEYAEALMLANQLGALEPENWLGKDENDKSFPEQNDALIKIANRRLTRLATYHRWTCFNPEKSEDPARHKKQLEALQTELDGYVDTDVCGLKPFIEAADWESFRVVAKSLLQNLQKQIESLLIQIANRTVPLRKKQCWQWKQNGGNSPYGQLVIVDVDINHSPHTRGQRGLSMSRIEQLDGLRKLFLRFNRALDKTPGTPATFGYADRGRESGEPCPQLLEKIDALKEQRVNQTAHLILAQALGLRLKASSLSPQEREKNDIHGEYEKIPQRTFVDFIVIEDLSRYTSSQGRAPSENSRLMKWAHRAVRDKIKMSAEEPFGIPIVEVQPAYSSRFHAVTGVAGARGFELTELASYQRESLEKLATAKKSASGAAQKLLDQFDELAIINQGLPAHKRHTLFYPRAGGPMFLAANGDKVTQADLNAASNLGLRAIASPQALDIHNKIRTEKKNNAFSAIKNNKREKAVFKNEASIVISPDEMSKDLGKSSHPNFFYDAALIGDFDRATWLEQPLTSGVSLWSSVVGKVMESALRMNRNRLDATDPIPM
jgi:IS605 OrfB family transposase